MSFDTLGLGAELLRTIADQGYTQPTPVQRSAIPPILEGRDVLAGAQTGTGKTAAFTLPILQRLAAGSGNSHRPRALILTPTRELAAQVKESASTYGRRLPLRAAAIYGGVGFHPQIDRLRRGVDILVATPGRLQDHIDRKTVDLSGVEILVLDEADRMLDMGFLPAVRRILSILPRRRQNLLFSATFGKEVRALAQGLLHDPEMIQIGRTGRPADGVTHTVHPVDRERKRELLVHLIGTGNWRRVLVFTSMKHGAERLAKQLDREGLSAASIHGNKSQSQRTRALDNFKKGSVRVLVATDVAARGLDIDEIPYVVNYELPNEPEAYIHRIGRTGRAGAKGAAVSLVCSAERGQLNRIDALLQKPIPQAVVPGFEPDPHARAVQRDHAGGNRSHHSNGRRGQDHAPSHGHRRRPAGRMRQDRRPAR